MTASTMSRRRLLRIGAAGAVAAAFPLPAIAETHTVKFTLPWLAQGTSTFPFVGRTRASSASADRLQNQPRLRFVARGPGDRQRAIRLRHGDFGAARLDGGQGLPLRGLATIDYDAMMGVGVLEGSNIKVPTDLVGKKMATVPASAESPFFAAYAKRIGIDAAKVDIVNVDPKVAERTLSGGQVDAMTGVASSSLPVLLSQNHPARWMLYSSVGMPTYGTDIVSSQSVVDTDPGLAAAMVDALLESVAFTITEPEESADIFFKAVPEAGLTAGARDFIHIGMGLHRYAIAKPAAVEHGLGWGDPAVYAAITDLVMTYLSTPDMKKPDVDSWYSNKLAGNIKLTSAQWSTVAQGIGEYRKYLT